MPTKDPRRPQRASATDSRQARKRAVKSQSQPQETYWINAVQREIQKREVERPAFAKSMRELARIGGNRAQNISDAEIEQAWNRYQLTRALGEARYQRSRFLSLSRDIRRLIKDLADASMQLKAGNLTERRAMISALWSVDSFLGSLGYHGSVLYQLYLDLQGLERGITASTLKADKKAAGRKRDSMDVQQVKGMLAGIARLQMTAGMSRNDAAAWVAHKVPSQLASRIASKPFISTRTVNQYMDQFDCGPGLLKKFKNATERKAFNLIFRRKRADDDDYRLPLEQIKYLRAEISPRKMARHKRTEINPLGGLFGFALLMHMDASFCAEGYEPSCNDLLKEVERIAVERIPSPRFSIGPSQS